MRYKTLSQKEGKQRTVDGMEYKSAVQSADCTADCTDDYKLNLYIPVYHTNRRPIKNMIGVAMNRLVGMAL